MICYYIKTKPLFGYGRTCKQNKITLSRILVSHNIISEHSRFNALNRGQRDRSRFDNLTAVS